MKERNSSDRRLIERRFQDQPIECERRTAQRRSGFDRREMAASQVS